MLAQALKTAGARAYVCWPPGLRSAKLKPDVFTSKESQARDRKMTAGLALHAMAVYGTRLGRHGDEMGSGGCEPKALVARVQPHDEWH
jgi:hypothetical protein